ncbi:PIN-like domain-containing protein [Chloroflexota bacterium]
MKEIFPGYYRPTEEEFARLWDKCIFIFDTNVLLDLYRYPKKTSDDLIRILKEISSRVWIPYQVAIEYQANRLEVVADQVNRCDEVKTYLNKTSNDIEKWFKDKQLEGRHPSIESKEFIEKLKGEFGGFIKELEVIEKKQPDVDDEDKIREEIDSIFKGRIGNQPSGQEYLDNIYKQGEERYIRKQPPGYKDIDKSNDDEKKPFFYGGLLFKRVYGDLILWNQTIDKAKEKEEFKNIIFIMSDSKEDWWEEARGRTIGPRPELFAELRSAAGVSLFYMYTTERFMAYAEERLGIKVEKESIKQAELYSQRKRLLDSRLLQIKRDTQGLREIRNRAAHEYRIPSQTLRQYGANAAAQTELANIQAAVHAMMVDNGLQVIPNPITIGSETNDMGAFPDATVTLASKGADAAFVTSAMAAGDITAERLGYILFRNQIVNDIDGDGTYDAGVDSIEEVNYVAHPITRGTYIVDAYGTVSQVTTGYE